MHETTQADPAALRSPAMVKRWARRYQAGMTEAGGASTQAGIYFQNSVAALYLAQLLQLDPMPPREQVVEVRVEAPTAVDDIVVRYADGHCRYLTAKLSIRSWDDAWDTLWSNVRAQAEDVRTRPDDRITIVVSDDTETTRDLRELCIRGGSALDHLEFASRLTIPQTTLLSRIGRDMQCAEERFRLLRRVDVRLLQEHEIQREVAQRLAQVAGGPDATILSVLRDLAGGQARTRKLFRAPSLRSRLQREHAIQVSEPIEWGLSAYRETVRRLARIEVPGSGNSRPASEVLVWPSLRDLNRAVPSDFDDELPPDRPDTLRSVIDMKSFPSELMDRLVVVAGPGYGKSALLSAVAERLASGPVTPVLVPLASLAASQASVADYLTENVNREFDVRVDWRRLAETGLVALLLDGLDEVPAVQRAPLMQRLRTFSARYPRVPWLLTARDPAVLTGTDEARILEILPLSDFEIVRFVDATAAGRTGLAGGELLRRLDGHPDLLRLARIPLFLSMMLSTGAVLDGSPTSRADLIERYLKTLFAPHEHKPAGGTPPSPASLRAVAATLAFERLEAGELGATEQKVRAVAFAQAGGQKGADELVAALVANGILRRQSSTRLRFPFPIVQEYLAATHLVEHAAGTLPARIDDAVRRPWAQALQFTLELHPFPAPYIRLILDRPADAFQTGLRLVARCIVNGATVDPALRAEVGDRLVDYWTHAHHGVRSRVGQMLFDGFARPISPRLRQALHHPWLMEDGAGAILSRALNRTLTMSVLDGMLRRPLPFFHIYRSLKPALGAVGDEAFARIVALLDGEPLEDSEHRGIDGLLSHFMVGDVTRDRALHAARDTRLPVEARLSCYGIAGRPLLPEAAQLTALMLRETESGAWHATDIIALAADPEEAFMAVLRDASIPEERRFQLAASLTRVFAGVMARESIIKRCLCDTEIPGDIAAVAMLHSAARGDRTAFESLVEMLPTLPTVIALQVVSLFGHHPGRPLAERAAALVQARTMTAAEAGKWAAAATCGMLYVFDMDWGFGGSLHDALPHAATDIWTQLVDQWSERADLTETQRFRILTAAAKLGSPDAQARLEAMVLAIENPDAPCYIEDGDLGSTMREAVREIRRRRALIPLALGERLARSEQANVPYAGVDAIAAHGDRAALNLLVAIHSDTSGAGERDTLESAIELLSSRLGLVIRRQGSDFAVDP